VQHMMWQVGSMGSVWIDFAFDEREMRVSFRELPDRTFATSIAEKRARTQVPGEKHCAYCRSTEEMRICACEWRGIRYTRLLECSLCDVVWYCDESCQALDWISNHEYSCDRTVVQAETQPVSRRRKQ
jgi:hypothetical protein